MRCVRACMLVIALLTLLALAGTAMAQLVPSDPDGDGLPTGVDRCPDVAGPRENGGCPLPAALPTDAPIQDRDSDGVADFVDACPDLAGTGFSNGCPIGDAGPTPTAGFPIPNAIGWHSYDTCLVAVAPITGVVNVRQEPTVLSPVIGQLLALQQFEPWFRDYDENNEVWFAGAPAGDQYGWVKDSVVSDNGACANLPMVIHIDNTDGPSAVADFDPGLIPQEQPDEHGDGWSLNELILIDFELGDWVLITDPDSGDATPTPAPDGHTLPGLFKLDGLNIVFCDGSVKPAGDTPATCDGSVMPTDQKPLSLVHRQRDGEQCTPAGPGLCLDSLLFLPELGEGEGQCTPEDFAKGLGLTGPDDPALMGLLLPAVQKVREAAAHGSGDGSPGGEVADDPLGGGGFGPGGDVADDPLGNGGFGPGGNVMQDFHFRTLTGDGSVMPADEVMQDIHFRSLLGDGSVVPGDDVLQDFHFRAPNTSCAMTVLTPGTEAGAVDMFVVLLPAVQ